MWVFAGCIMGEKEYDSLGNDLYIPSMFFKIIIMEVDSVPKIAAFLFPHFSETHGVITDYLVSIDIIESLTGLDFFTDLEMSGKEIWEMERKSTYNTWKSFFQN